jgi:hypothetical protein
MSLSTTSSRSLVFAFVQFPQELPHFGRGLLHDDAGLAPSFGTELNEGWRGQVLRVTEMRGFRFSKYPISYRVGLDSRFNVVV